MLLVLISFLLISSTLANEPFEYEDTFIHKETRSKAKVKGRGTLVPMVKLDDNEAIRRVVCEDDVIFIVAEDIDVANDWVPGQLIVGGPKWGCTSVVEDGIRKNSIFRKIVKIKKKAKYVEVITAKSRIWDMFEHAHIDYTHEPEEEVRMKRDITGDLWPPHFHAKDDNFFSFKLNYDTAARKAMYKFELSKDGLTAQTLNSAHKFQYPKPEFKCPNCLFNSTCKLACDSCYYYVQQGFTFTIKISSAPRLELFLMQFRMEVGMEMDVSYTIGCEKSIDKEFGLSEAFVEKLLKKTNLATPRITIFRAPNPAIPDVQLGLNFKPNMTIKLSGKISAEVMIGAKIRSKNTYITTLKKEGGGEFKIEREVVVDENNGGSTKWEAKGALEASLALIPKVIFEPLISWGYGVYRFDIARLYFTAPITLSFEAAIEAKAELKLPDNTLCLELTHKGTLKVEGEHIMFKIVILDDEKWAKPVLNRKMSYSYEAWKGNFALCNSANPCCLVFCFGDSERRANRRIEDAIGAATKQITRADPEFSQLIQVKGSDMLFLSEEKNNIWCGYRGRQCVDCTKAVKGHTNEEKCADRLMANGLAERLGKLTKYLKMKWPKRKLIVEEAWDEPTDSRPTGRFSSTSPHYEGRAAILMMSVELSSTQIRNPSTTPPGTDASLQKELGQLAVCSGFDYVKKTSGGKITVGVKKSGSSQSTTHGKFQHWMKNNYRVNIAACEKYKSRFPALSVGQASTSDSQVDVCGPIDQRITRTDKLEFSRLYEYPYEDVVFSNEESSEAWCGVEFWDCPTKCGKPDHWPWDYWERCPDRLMTKRLAYRLRRLANIVQQKWPGVKVKVLEAWDEVHASSTHPWGQFDEDSLHYEGRAAQLTLDAPDASSKLAELSYLAQCAGFDYVKHSTSSYLTVCVKSESSSGAVAVPFLETYLLAVEPPTNKDHHEYPDVFKDELQQTLLFDGNRKRDNRLSQHFKVREFMHSSSRFFRVDAKLVFCLQEARDYFKKPMGVKKDNAYKPKPVNIVNIDDRHPEEQYRHQSGQAVLVKLNTGSKAEQFELAKFLMKSCAEELMMTRRGIGIGLRDTYLYFDVRQAPENNGTMYIKLWTVDSDYQDDLDKLQQLQTRLLTGGPPIIPTDKDEACEKPELGYDNWYFIFQLEESRADCHSGSSTFCTETKKHREELYNRIHHRVKTKVRFQYPRDEAAEDALRECVMLCNLCTGSGPIWKKKLLNCMEILRHYEKHSGVAFANKKDKIAFFNIDNRESTVRRVACDEHHCVESTEMYAMFSEMLISRYRPEPGSSVEELLYSPADNPTPIIDITEQLLAKRASGIVRVFIQKDDDISALRKVLKILMVYNRDVEKVEFHVGKDANMDNVEDAILRKMEIWKAAVCPEWGRDVIAPVDVVELPSHRLKRSVPEDQIGPASHVHSVNWELDWLSKS